MKQVTEKEYAVIDKKAGLLTIFDLQANIQKGEQRIKRVYRLVDEETVEPIDFGRTVREIIAKVSEKVDVNKLLEEVLTTTTPEEVLEALRRLQQPKILKETKAKPHCYGIVIPGNKGQKPIELLINSG